MPDLPVCIIDDEPEIRDSIAMLLKSVGIATRIYPSATEYLAAADPSDASCLIADVRMPGISGLELQEVVHRRRPGLPVIIITGHGDIAMAVRAMKAGAADFIEKPFSGQSLIDAVQRAISAQLASADEAGQRARFDALLATLTPREREVLLLVAEGRPNKVVATRLGLSTRTVETHRANIMQKLEARSLADLVKIAIACGLMQP